MKATGIVRRIDDLGRIVIPKEIRRTLRIREADPLEIFTDREGEIILKKYSPIGEMSTFAKQYAESLAQAKVWRERRWAGRWRSFWKGARSLWRAGERRTSWNRQQRERKDAGRKPCVPSSAKAM